MAREQLGNRLGFLLVSAGCAIGLGNIWRFPFVVGAYGGGAFVLIYLFFLFFLATPILVMEFAVGRAARLNVVGAFAKLEPKGTKWHYFGYIAMLGNYLLMMFYTSVVGGVLAYCYYYLSGDMLNLSQDQIKAVLVNLLTNPWTLLFWLFITILIGSLVCGIGLQNGVERITKIMMLGLFAIMLILVVYSVSLPNAMEGIKFYLLPDFDKMLDKGLWTSLYAALGQTFFTLSIGIGSMTIFGSYINKDRSLTGESITIVVLDTTVALLAGVIIFSACFAFGVSVDSGPGLVFVTLPNVFNSMAFPQFWGTLFFLLMSFAALSSVIATFENIIAYSMDSRGFSRKKAAFINFFIIFFGSIPCVLGFNLWSSVQPIGKETTILDLLDFVVSENMFPLGALVYLLFCCTRYGWGWDNFIAEADIGKGMKFPKFLRAYLTFFVPAVMIFIFIKGYIDKFF